MGLFITLIIFAIGLLWFVIRSKGRLIAKVFYILATAYFSTSAIITAHDLAGWPSQDNLPEEFYPIWIEVKEPNKKTGSPGFIYIWCYSFEHNEANKVLDRFFVNFNFNKNRNEPRSYRIEYSRESHVAANKITKAMSDKKYIKVKRSEAESLSIGNEKFEIIDVYKPKLK